MSDEKSNATPDNEGWVQYTTRRQTPDWPVGTVAHYRVLPNQDLETRYPDGTTVVRDGQVWAPPDTEAPLPWAEALGDHLVEWSGLSFHECIEAFADFRDVLRFARLFEKPVAHTYVLLSYCCTPGSTWDGLVARVGEEKAVELLSHLNERLFPEERARRAELARVLNTKKDSE